MARRSPLLFDGRALLDADRLLTAGLSDRRASFELWLPRLSGHLGFAVMAGVETLLEVLGRPLVEARDLDAALRAGRFSEALVSRLSRLSLGVDVDAVPDGAVVFPRSPLLVIEGPYVEVVLVASLARSIVQRGVVAATRVARLSLAAAGDGIVDGCSSQLATLEAAVDLARAAFVGGAVGTTNPVAAAALRIPFLATGRLELPTAGAASDGWGDGADELRELGSGDDEEAILVEAKRLGQSAAGWIARGLSDFDGACALRCDLVAFEEGGAWTPCRGASGAEAVVPGRKMIVRYTDEAGKAVADVVHKHGERMQPPRALGARTLAPLARPAIRGGRALDAPEPPQAGRDRGIVARLALPPPVAQLRAPAAYPVRLSPGLRDGGTRTSVPPPRR